jgi:hypothetical protein
MLTAVHTPWQYWGKHSRERPVLRARHTAENGALWESFGAVCYYVSNVSGYNRGCKMTAKIVRFQVNGGAQDRTNLPAAFCAGVRRHSDVPTTVYSGEGLVTTAQLLALCKKLNHEILCRQLR